MPSLKQLLAGVLTYVAGMLIDMGVDNYMARKIGSYESFIKEKKESATKEALEKAAETVATPPPPKTEHTEHTSGFTRDEAAEYTRNMAVEHLVASEDHLRAAAAGQDVKLCVSCLPPGTIVLTNHPKKIEEVTVGDTVLTHNGLFRKVTKTFKRWYEGNIVVIKTRGYNVPLIITPEHPILVSRNIYTWQRTLRRSTPLRKYGGRGGLEKPKWIPAIEVKEGDGIAFPKIRTIYNKTNKSIYLSNYVDKPLRRKDGFISIKSKGGRGRKWVKEKIPIDDKLLEFIGYYIAEGFVATNLRGKYVKLTFGKHEKDLVNRVVSLVKEIFGFEPIVYEKRTALEVHIGSYIVASWIEKEFGRDSHTKRLPAWLLYLPNDKLKVFLKAYIKGDGSITNDKRGYKIIGFATVSPYLALELRAILFKLGINHYVYYKEGGEHVIEGRKVRVSPTWFFEIFADAYKLDVSSKVRKERYVIETEEYIIIPVEKVEVKPYKGWVYNLEVNEYNSYVTMWGALHNCLVEHHFPALRQYAREGKKFCRSKSECEAYDYLYQVVGEVERRLLEGDTNLIELAERLRSARKLLSPSMQVLKQLEEKLKELEKLGEEEKTEKEGGVATSPPVVFHESPSCIPEVKEKIVKVAPKVAKVLSKKGFTLKPVRIDVKEGTVVKDGLESCAATDPDSNPIRQLYNCACWSEMGEKEKEKIVAHELAHAFGVRDEGEAEKIAEEAVK